MPGASFQHLGRDMLAKLATGPNRPSRDLGALAEILAAARAGSGQTLVSRGVRGEGRLDSRAIVGDRRALERLAAFPSAGGDVTDTASLPEEVRVSAAEAVDRMRRGESPERLTPTQRRGLEAIVAVFGRPSLLTRGGFPERPFPPDWRFMTELKSDITLAAASVGRINVSRFVLPYAGTGFVVGEDLVLTNRHVAEIFGEPGDEARSPGAWRVRDGYRPRVDFVAEFDPTTPIEFTVRRIVHVDPRPEADVALLQLARESESGEAELPKPLKIARRREIGRSGDQVYNIGYPAFDPFADYDVLSRIFGTAFRVKRLAPGELRDSADLPDLPVERFDLVHDCSTLGGSSGSFVMHINTGQVIGLHYYGTQFVGNQAIHLSELANEPFMADVNYVDETPVAYAGAIFDDPARNA